MRKMKNWKKLTAVTLACSMAAGIPAMAAGEEAGAEEKPRIIITQDAEVDDLNSLVHTLLYANDLDIAGIVQSSSSLHFMGDEAEGIEPQRWPGTEWMGEVLDAYAEVYDNLIVHDPDYPSPDELRAITVVGNIKSAGEMEEVTEGSELIKNCILDEDSRKLYIAIGGGANTVGRALKSIEEEYKDTEEWDALYAKICEKVVLQAWGQQDAVYEEYICVNWPDMKMVDVSGASGPYGYSHAKQNMSVAAHKKMEGMWIYENLETGHGALLDQYVTWGDGTYLPGEESGSQFGTNEDLVGTNNWWGGQWMGLVYNRYDFLSEGDSPDWIITIPTGLRSLEDETYGGWGGRYVRSEFEGNPDAVYFAEAPGETSMGLWVEAIQNEFAARADWCVTKKYEDANHAPSVSVAEGIDLTAAAGAEVALTAEASDPDGDEISYKWWQYAQADTYEEKEEGEGVVLTVNEENPAQVTVTVPADAKSGDTIHVILEARDNGTHNLTAYQRVIITVE